MGRAHRGTERAEPVGADEAASNCREFRVLAAVLLAPATLGPRSQLRARRRARHEGSTLVNDRANRAQQTRVAVVRGRGGVIVMPSNNTGFDMGWLAGTYPGQFG